MKNVKCKVAIYIRVGRKEQLDIGKKLQKQLIENYLEKERNYRITGYYIDDGYSGLNFKRPMFQKMLEEIERGNIDRILVSDFARISRNIIELDNFVNKILIPRNIKLTSIRDNNDFYHIQKNINSYFIKKIANDNGRKHNNGR